MKNQRTFPFPTNIFFCVPSVVDAFAAWLGKLEPLNFLCRWAEEEQEGMFSLLPHSILRHGKAQITRKMRARDIFNVFPNNGNLFTGK